MQTCRKKPKSRICLEGKTILVTGSPGFIGANLVIRLLKEMKKGRVISFDSLNNYYDVGLKEYRLRLIDKAASESHVNHIFIKGNLADKKLLNEVFEKYRPDLVVNLAAQAGVRNSIDHPEEYIQSNIIGFFNILEACRHYTVEHLIYASSSSVYGGSKKIPFNTGDKVDSPVSLYAATKKSDELLAYSYSKLYNIPCTGLRLFTVYGPAGRPDMFYYSATKKLCKGEHIQIFNYGEMKRDFTYVDDIVEGIVRVMKGAPEKSIGEDGLTAPPYSIYNIGGGTPENLLEFINVLQRELVRAGLLSHDYDFEAHRELVGMQPGDVPITYADSSELERDYGFKPTIDINTGLRKFAEWYKGYQSKGEQGAIMGKKLISIIVTVYNRENYIRKCLDSVLGQQDVNTEIVIVDDGSTDSTPQICDEYAVSHSNIRVIHQKNGGLSVARNVGLDNVKGDYIVFMDDDDALPDGSLSRMYELLLANDADFVMGNYAEYDDDGNFIKVFDIPEKYCNKLISKREACELLLFSEQTHVLMVSWGKMFKREVWENIRFPAEIVKSEDQFIFPQLMKNCERIYFTSEIMYHQTMSKVSITRSKVSRKFLYHSEGVLKVMDYLIEMKYFDIAVFKFGFGTRHLIWVQKQLNDEECRKEIERLVVQYKIFAKKLIPYAGLKDKFRLILFITNYNFYRFLQNISAWIYVRKHCKTRETIA